MAINNRYDFVFLFDVENGNPNGDPDAGNNPRVDAETGYGFITDVCLKRKIRNYVELCKEEECSQDGSKAYNILIKPDNYLNAKFTEAYKKEGLKTKQKVKNPEDITKARDYMCRNYYDVRTFGAVMSTGDDQCGIVRGPVQINFAKSQSPVYIEDITITRQARTTEDRKKQEKQKWEEKVLFLMVYTVQKAIFLLLLPIKLQGLMRKMWNCSGCQL